MDLKLMNAMKVEAFHLFYSFLIVKKLKNNMVNPSFSCFLCCKNCECFHKINGKFHIFFIILYCIFFFKFNRNIKHPWGKWEYKQQTFLFLVHHNFEEKNGKLFQFYIPYEIGYCGCVFFG